MDSLLLIKSYPKESKDYLLFYGPIRLSNWEIVNCEKINLFPNADIQTAVLKNLTLYNMG
jgi:hypothetical protein